MTVLAWPLFVVSVDCGRGKEEASVGLGQNGLKRPIQRPLVLTWDEYNTRPWVTTR